MQTTKCVKHATESLRKEEDCIAERMKQDAPYGKCDNSVGTQLWGQFLLVWYWFMSVASSS